MNNRENRRARRSTGRHPVSKTDIGRGNLIAALIFLIPVLLGAGIILHARAAGSTTQAVASTPADTQSGYATASDTATTSDPNVHEVDAKDLKPGDAVVMKDGRTEIVKSVMPEAAPDGTQVASTDTSPPSDAAASSSSADEWILAPDHVSPPLPNGDPAPLPVAHSAQAPGFHVVKLLKTETDGNKIILTGTNQDTGQPETIVGMRRRDTVFTLADPSKAKLPTKVIQDVHQGDLVATRNPVTGATEFRRVVQTYKHIAYSTITVTLADSKTGKHVDSLTATPEHPFFVPGRGAIPLGQLSVGTKIVTRAGAPLVIASLFKHEYPNGIPVYNFQVQGDHTYFVGMAHGGEWVHNNCLKVDPFDVRFTQDSIGSHFAEGDLAGTSLEDAIASAKSTGSLPEGLNINVTNVNGDWVTLNNRSLYVAQQAGLGRVPVTDVGVSGWNRVNSMLNGSGLEGPLPFGTQPVVR